MPVFVSTADMSPHHAVKPAWTTAVRATKHPAAPFVITPITPALPTFMMIPGASRRPKNERKFCDNPAPEKGAPQTGAPIFVHSIALREELLFLLKSILVQPANGADEILRQILPSRAGLNAVIGITEGGVVLISTGANVFHNLDSFRVCKIQYCRVSAILFHVSWRRVGSHHTGAAWLLRGDHAAGAEPPPYEFI